jgi:Spy/CpxP family protein refolding chaperone
MNSGMKMLLGVAAGTFLLGMAIPFAWADGGIACKGGGSHAMGMARHGMSNHGGMTSYVLHSLLKHQQDLGLTEDQVTKLKALALDQDRAKIRAQADVQVAKRELRALVTDDKTELSVIEAKIKERESFEAKLSFMRIKAKRDLYGVLTPEQSEKQNALRHQMQQIHRARTFSSQGQGQGIDTPGHEQSTEGMTSVPEETPRDVESSLQNS